MLVGDVIDDEEVETALGHLLADLGQASFVFGGRKG